MNDSIARRQLLLSSVALAQSNAKAKKFAVVGAGVFGAWTAYHLRRLGHEVTLIDQYGPSNSRASSGGESRIIRARYGTDKLYTQSVLRSLKLWTEFFTRIERPSLFHRTGVLWMTRQGDHRLGDHTRTLQEFGVSVENLAARDLRRRYPQIAVEDDTVALFEPNAGALMARQAVQAVIAQFLKDGGIYRQDKILTPAGTGAIKEIRTAAGERIAADAFLFACGPWLQQVLPDLLGNRIFPTRQVIYFFGTPAGDRRFRPPLMPTWGDSSSDSPWYGLPDLENRGFKVAYGWLGASFDPDTGIRQVTTDEIAEVRAFVTRRFPALAQAPLVETRVCQYENTANADFVIDRHPAHENIWFAGGGSGHGFKHGPAVGEYTAARLIGLEQPAIEARFSLASKATELKRRIMEGRK
ncbi:FAD-dependent oxidoreductase [Bryobacter aggregatus]|uniref:FAD-dependent oxidoreductase n=1 Tax=Bryobacter aggregatus TaxID=360054 RepID=UPI0004E1C4D4|nr:FAD-dependent oxidoreductase [Bryobacter aggregatus]